MTTGRVDARGRIVRDDGIFWMADDEGLYSLGPRGYYIERLAFVSGWVLYRRVANTGKMKGYRKEVLTRGTVSQCMQVAEIAEIRRVVRSGVDRIAREDLR